MKSSPQEQAVEELLIEFDTEMDRLRHKFNVVIKNYETKQTDHLREIIQQMKSF